MDEHEPVTSDDEKTGIDRVTLWMFWAGVAICAGFGGWALFFRAA
jgi:LPXTG-motif cell wall-anchored protein